MIDVRALEQILELQFRVTTLVQSYERDDFAFVDDVKQWLAETEEKLLTTRSPVVSELALLRGVIVAAERGNPPPDLGLTGAPPSKRKLKSIVAFNSLRKAEEIVRTNIKPLAVQVSDGEAMLRQLVAMALQKGIRATGAEALWDAIAADDELRTPAAHVIALLGRTNITVLLERLIARRDVLV